MSDGAGSADAGTQNAVGRLGARLRNNGTLPDKARAARAAADARTDTGPGTDDTGSPSTANVTPSGGAIDTDTDTPNCAHSTTTRTASKSSSADHSAAMDKLREALRNKAANVAEALLGPPNRKLSSRRELRWNGTGSIAVQIAGPKAGLAYDYAAAEGGDLIWLIRRERACDFDTAAAWGANTVGMRWPNRKGNGADHTHSANAEQRQKDREHKRIEQEAAAAADKAGRINAAQRTWDGCVPIDGTVAETYLIECRKIPKPDQGWPDALRFLADVTVALKELDKNAIKRTVPTAGALVIAATLRDGTVNAIQRVFLQDDGDNLRYSDAKKIKRSRGVFAESAAGRLPGQTDCPLLVTEGPETALSVWRATGYETLIAFGGLGKLSLRTDRPIIICRDDDALDSPADQAIARTITKWREAGAKAVIATPWPEPRDDTSDFNDTLKKGGLDAVKARIEIAQLYDQASILAAIEAADPRASAVKLLIQILRQAYWTEGERHPLIQVASEREPLIKAAAEQADVNLTAVRSDVTTALKAARKTQEARQMAARAREAEHRAMAQHRQHAARVATDGTVWPKGFDMRPDGLWLVSPPLDGTEPT